MAASDKVHRPTMIIGIVCGTLAALAWGLADVFITYLSRRGGFFKPLVITQAVGVALLVVIALALEDLPGPSTAQLLALAQRHCEAIGPPIRVFRIQRRYPVRCARRRSVRTARDGLGVERGANDGRVVPRVSVPLGGPGGGHVREVYRSPRIARNPF